ncbi:MAG: ATP synthase F0 subunit B [Deltaproteobacteria bacterium]|nr:ATP synthase F0 subunit B [Deltaproteobacteria bacterium]
MLSCAVMVVVALLVFNLGAVFASEGGEGHGEAAPKGWIATDTYRVMNFAVLFIALFFLLKKPLSNALNARITGIKEQLEELEAKKAEAEKQLSEYNERLSMLDKEAEGLIAEYVKQGEEAKVRIIEAAEATAVKLEEQAKKHIEHEFQQAKDQLQEEILQKALAKAEEIIKTKINAEDQDRLVDEYLEKVVA